MTASSAATGRNRSNEEGPDRRQGIQPGGNGVSGFIVACSPLDLLEPAPDALTQPEHHLAHDRETNRQIVPCGLHGLSSRVGGGVTSTGI